MVQPTREVTSHLAQLQGNKKLWDNSNPRKCRNKVVGQVTAERGSIVVLRYDLGVFLASQTGGSVVLRAGQRLVSFHHLALELMQLQPVLQPAGVGAVGENVAVRADDELAGILGEGRILPLIVKTVDTYFFHFNSSGEIISLVEVN